jgi:hypothetical protein
MGLHRTLGTRIGIDAGKVPDPPVSHEPIAPERYYSREFWQREWERCGPGLGK